MYFIAGLVVGSVSGLMFAWSCLVGLPRTAKSNTILKAMPVS